jgi:hypothetical protein
MFDEFHYVPLLKAKAGEMRALQDLREENRDGITPLLDVVPIPWDFVEDRPAKAVDQHLATLASQTERSWGTERTFFVDLATIEDEPLIDGRAPLRHVMDAYRAIGAQAIPVTGPGRSAAYQAAVTKAAQTDHRGVCVRVPLEELGKPQRLRDTLVALLADLGVTAAEADLILDFEAIRPSQVSLVVSQATLLFDALSQAAWRSLTFAAGAFPESLERVGADTIDLIARSDWAAWQSLVLGDEADLQRFPAFGDYGIAGVEFSEIDPRIMQMSANVRYTAEDAWVILKGRSVKKGFDQFHRLSAALVRRTDFCGEAFSAGDQYIARCARREVGPGNATTWRQVGTNHHLTFVERALANLSASSTSA